MTLTENSQALLGVSITFTTVAMMTVLLRLLSRKTTKMIWGWDDQWIIVALLNLATLCGMTIWSAVVGGAKDLDSQPEDIQVKSFETFLKAQFIGSIFYLGTITSVRFSLTCFFRHIFPVKSLRIVSIIIDTFNAIYFISCFFTNVFSCTPIDYLWNPVPGGGCLAKFNLFVAITESFGIFLDFVILTLPVRSLMPLQMAPKTKAMISGIFLLGGFVVITGIVRVILIYNSSGAYVNFLSSDVWTTIHASTGVICANLPTFKPLFPRIHHFTSSLMRRYANLRYGTNHGDITQPVPTKNVDNTSTYSAHVKSSGSRMGSRTGLASSASGSGSNTAPAEESYELHQMDLDQIRVKRTVDIV